MRDASFEQVVGMLFNLDVSQHKAAQEQTVGLVTDETGAISDPLAQVKGLGGAGQDAEPQLADEPDTPEPQRQKAPAAAAPLARGLGTDSPQNLVYTAPDESGQAHRTGATATATKKVGRNQPCPCGSGKKYKMCHGRAQ